MLVFGDLESQETPSLALPVLAARWRAALAAPPGVARHASLVAIYLEASRIAQGCVDQAFAGDGCDAATPLHEGALTALGAMARVVAASWENGLVDPRMWDDEAFARFMALAPEGPVTARTPEGFAFYALYPEACLEAAGDDRDTVVIGLRSIGMALAPLVAQRLNARFTITLRPTGHPFARRVSLHADLAARLIALRHARFAIVDEGPGLSGSSFGAVADWLENIGVARDRITFYAGHAGELGPQASEAHRTRWARADRRPLTLPDLAERHLPDWLGDLCGALCEPLRDMSGGLWRNVAPHHARAPANRPFERRKFLARTQSGVWLAKFTGLGDIGARKADIAGSLAHAGFTPPVAGLRHGFLVERWIEDAQPVSQAPREVLIARIGDYLAFRARALPAALYAGARLEALLEMGRHNTAQALGEATAARLVQRLGSPAALHERPVATDNRMQAWEWLTTRDGAILKTDAADHHAGHDLIGARDIAWDVAGAVAEFDLSADERASLTQRMAAHGAAPDAGLIGFFLPLYCAFQLGAADMAASANAPWPEDAQRWGEQRQRYATALRRWIETGEL